MDEKLLKTKTFDIKITDVMSHSIYIEKKCLITDKQYTLNIRINILDDKDEINKNERN